MSELTIRVKEKTKELVGVNVSRTLGGDYMMSEHPEIDVVILPRKNKLLILPKGELSEYIYKIQKKLLDFLKEKGVIFPDTVKGGNVYGSLEAKFPSETVENLNPVEILAVNIQNFVNKERPSFEYLRTYQDTMEDEIVNPSVEDSTEQGEVPQSSEQGSIPRWGYQVRGIYRYNY